MTSTTASPAPSPTPGGDIALVVATELELEQLLARAREEARVLAEQAYQDSGTQVAALERELDEARQRFTAEVGAERDRRVAEVLEQGARAAARYDTVTEDRLATLAALVLSRLVARGPG